MSIPKTGARAIVVDGVAYRWLIRRKATHSQTDYGTGCLHVAIELVATELGTTAVLWTDRQHPKDWATNQAHPVTPWDVSHWIGKALALGWVPAAKGSPVFFKAEGEQLERVAAVK